MRIPSSECSFLVIGSDCRGENRPQRSAKLYPPIGRMAKCGEEPEKQEKTERAGGGN
jgi:hypothetical protein